MQATTMTDESEDGGRRRRDRRKAQLPFEGVDRRKDDRREGNDRRSGTRISID